MRKVSRSVRDKSGMGRTGAATFLNLEGGE